MCGSPTAAKSPTWRLLTRQFGCVAAILLLSAAAGVAQTPPETLQISPHQGEMSASLQAPEDQRDVTDTLVFEPWELIEEMFLRNDVVWVMRHGPTDWSKLDIKDVAPADCANQRILSAQGRIDMKNLGILLAENDVLPGRIVVSQWCRNQQTVETLLEGAALVDPAYPSQVVVETNPALNLLLALQGAPSVRDLREIVSSWTGEGADGPLLVITHFTNIQEMLDFSVYEGEVLVVDPKRANRVLGYLRLKSAGPDVGHFKVE